jgi:hypothetical protein
VPRIPPFSNAGFVISLTGDPVCVNESCGVDHGAKAVTS